jgi:hypothetical protein
MEFVSEGDLGERVKKLASRGGGGPSLVNRRQLSTPHPIIGLANGAKGGIEGMPVGEPGTEAGKSQRETLNPKP